MIYLYKTKITLSESDTEKTIRDQLKSKFTITPHQGYFTIVRDRIIGNRGIVRVLFPVLISKIILKDNFLYYKTKLDGLAFFILIMSLGAILVEFNMDRELYPRKYPPFLPVAFFAWYMISILIEVFRINKTLTKKFNKKPHTTKLKR